MDACTPSVLVSRPVLASDTVVDDAVADVASVPAAVLGGAVVVVTAATSVVVASGVVRNPASDVVNANVVDPGAAVEVVSALAAPVVVKPSAAVRSAASDVVCAIVVVSEYDVLLETDTDGGVDTAVLADGEHRGSGTPLLANPACTPSSPTGPSRWRG